jgi:hypothetical protein
MEISETEALKILSQNIGNHAGFNGVNKPAEGIIHSTRFGVIELKDGNGGFSPSIYIKDVEFFTVNRDDFYTVVHP